jgi:hypothetical protein
MQEPVLYSIGVVPVGCGGFVPPHCGIEHTSLAAVLGRGVEACGNAGFAADWAGFRFLSRRGEMEKAHLGESPGFFPLPVHRRQPYGSF